MFGLAQTFQKPLIISKLADPPTTRSSWSSDSCYFSNGSSRTGSPTLEDNNVWTGQLWPLHPIPSSERRTSRGSSMLQQVKTTLSFLIPSSFTSEVTATKTNGESVTMSSLYGAEYVFVRSDSEPMVEGPYRVIQRNQCLFKLDLGDHHKWVAVEKLEPTSLSLTEQEIAQPVVDEPPPVKGNWLRRNIKNRMSMPNRMRHSMRRMRFNVLRRNSQVESPILVNDKT